MLFTSLNFIVFFCLVTVIYYLTTQRLRWIVLLLSSLVFYFFSTPVDTVILVFSILLNWLFGLWIDHNDENRRRKQIMIFGIAINLILLLVFRYGKLIPVLIPGHFLRNNIDPLISWFIVPLGISFYTFTNISYLIEIKRKRITSVIHPGYFACYISFF